MILQPSNKATQIIMDTFSGGSYEITKIVTSDRDYSETELLYLNDLFIKDQFTPSKIYTSKGYGYVEGTITNRNVTTTYPLRTVGVYAKIKTPGKDKNGSATNQVGKEFLFASMKLDIPIKMEPYANKDIQASFKGVFAISATDTVAVNESGVNLSQSISNLEVKVEQLLNDDVLGVNK